MGREALSGGMQWCYPHPLPSVLSETIAWLPQSNYDVQLTQATMAEAVLSKTQRISLSASLTIRFSCESIVPGYHTMH